MQLKVSARFCRYFFSYILCLLPIQSNILLLYLPLMLYVATMTQIKAEVTTFFFQFDFYKLKEKLYHICNIKYSASIKKLL